MVKQVIEIAPWNYYTHVRLMAAEEGGKQWQTLARHAKTVNARYPSDATVLVYLARAEDKLAHTKSAKAAYQQCIEQGDKAFFDEFLREKVIEQGCQRNYEVATEYVQKLEGEQP